MTRSIVLCITLLLTFIASVGSSVYAQIITDSNHVDLVKTVTLYKNGVDLEAPILTLGGDDQLLLRFDILGPEVDNYHYRIQHCDRNWRPDELQPYEFINGFEESPIDNYNPSFTTLQPYVNYFQLIPASYSHFLVSGNYVVSVFPQDYPDSILFTRRFCVTEESLRISASISVPFDNHDIQRRRQLDVFVESNPDYAGDLIPPTLNPAYLSIIAQQNGRLDNLRQLPFSGYDRNALAYCNRPENIFYCGNTFRFFDISNIRTAIYNVASISEYGGEWFAMLKPLEDRSHKPFVSETVLNGGMKVNVWDRSNAHTEADYVYVNFSLPMQYPFMNGNIYLIGDLTQWHLDNKAQFQYNPDIHAYTLRLLLKQGYYSYQILFLPIGDSQGLTGTLEGDHFQAPNNYRIFAYYHSPADHYDRLCSLISVNN